MIFKLFVDFESKIWPTPIIIPVYNAENYIENCIESVLNQSYGDIEILVVNDGSTDSTGSVLEKYRNRIQIFNKKIQVLHLH